MIRVLLGDTILYVIEGSCVFILHLSSFGNDKFSETCTSMLEVVAQKNKAVTETMETFEY